MTKVMIPKVRPGPTVATKAYSRTSRNGFSKGVEAAVKFAEMARFDTD